jgi:hypothetical protein
MPTAIDLSNWTGLLDPSAGPAFRDHARRMIANTHDPLTAAQQLIVGEDHCMEPQLYAFHYIWTPLTRELDKAEAIRERLERDLFLWLDFEGGSLYDADHDYTGISPDAILGWISRSVFQAQARGFSIGIYTNKSWWQIYTNDETYFFQDLKMPLWAASWPLPGNPVPANPYELYEPFGGVDRPAMLQHTGSFSLAGRGVGVSVYD